MSVAVDLRKQVEAALASRFPSALSPRPPAPAELLPSGVPEVDSLLGGGLPLGAITELTGAHSSGRTTLVLSVLAGITGQGDSCAYMDTSDNLDPASAAALGVDLRRLLWVRAARAEVAPESSSPVIPPGLEMKRNHLGRAASPAREGNIHLHKPVPSELPRRTETTRRKSTWASLEKALRATDLLLNTGGFRAIVLDMGDIAPEQARRVPLATWYRFRLQAEKACVLFLLVTRIACANSCAALSLQCAREDSDWEQAARHSPHLLTGLGYRITVQRNHSKQPPKKPAAFAEACWHSATSWAG